MIRPAIISSGEWSGLVSVSAAPRRYGLEESLISGFKRIMPILALGKPGEAQGVGRILTDENSWKAAISELLRHSSLIICIPSGHPGSLWELTEIIQNGYLSKAVFLMPPNRPGTLKWFFTWWQWKYRIDDWNTAVSHMKSHGIVIPGYRKNGLLFSVHPEVGCFIEHLNLMSSRRLRKAILRLSIPIPSSKRWEEKPAILRFPLLTR